MQPTSRPKSVIPEGRLNPPALLAGIEAIRERFDVNDVVFHHLPGTADEIGATTYSLPWVEQYVGSRFHEVDPTLRLCGGTFNVVDWASIDWSSKARTAFREESRGAGIGANGLSVPVRLRDGAFSVFTVSHHCSDAQWGRFRKEKLTELILAGYRLQQDLFAQVLEVDQPSRPRLNEREKQVLRLLVAGHGVQRIADILALSDSSIQAYLKSARFKLQATNTVHACAIAMSRGIIEG